MQNILSRSAALRGIQRLATTPQTAPCRSLRCTSHRILPFCSSTGNATNPYASGGTASSIAIDSKSKTAVTIRSYSSHNNRNSDDEGSGARSSLPQGSNDSLRRAYVHPLSQVVLEYLQDCHHDWVVSKGLDRSLTLHRDGSFEARYVPPPVASKSCPPLPPALQISAAPKHHAIPGRGSGAEPVISATVSASAAKSRDDAEREASAKATGTGTLRSSSGSDRESNRATPVDQEPAQATSTDSNHGLGSNNNSNNNNNHDHDTQHIRIWTSFDEQEKKHWLTVRKGLFRQRFLLQDNLLTAWQGNRGTSLPERIHVAVDEMIRAVDRLDQPSKVPVSSPTGHFQQWHQKGQRRFRKR
ncbi:unnamed protein product [Pseudo-nitzschia multistriata]|uniref:Uncharacterized protein n=1 Tax=Pseudo-nitzschia multistriata TaxID=183589 RepID=A0A448ZSM3_9STRA|nr:unnamed protein product [Pseudo-nitzschia multistriata]